MTALSPMPSRPNTRGDASLYDSPSPPLTSRPLNAPRRWPMPPPVEPPSPATPFPPANQLGLGNLQLPRRPLDRPSLSARPAQGRSSELLSETLHMITIGSRRPQSVRGIYQLTDEHGNTLVDRLPWNPMLQWAGGSIACGAPDRVSGIGECSGTLSPPSLFASERLLPLSLVLGLQQDVRACGLRDTSSTRPLPPRQI